MKVISIDPGLSGAIIEWVSAKPITVFDMPTTKAASKTIVDPIEVARILNEFKPHKVIIEHVGASPQMGVGSAFNFGMGFGILMGCAAGTGSEVVLVTPQKWKAVQGLLKKPKDAARARAADLYPEVAFWFKRKKDVDRADAILIGDFYHKFLGGGAK